MRKRVYKKGFWYDCYNIGIEDLDTFIGKLYLGGKSTNEIAEYFFSKYKITVSGRNICNYVSKLGITRSKSEGKAVAIKSGRMVYRKKENVIFKILDYYKVDYKKDDVLNMI